MDPTRLMPLAATITPMNAGTPDVYGDEVLAAGTTTATTCWGHQTARTESTVNANTQAQTWTFYFPATVTLRGEDRVSIGNLTYEVIGPPHTWTDPRTGDDAYIEATLRRVV